jgi:ABC-type antimicrobial peptide transport system permease subunit
MTAVVVPERGAAPALAPAIRQAIQAADPDVPVSFQTMDQRVAAAVADRRLTMTVLAVFAAVALVLACVGIYGVVSYAVARRSREIGIRIALGADPAAVRRLVQKDPVVGVALGAAAGALLALSLGRVLATLLFGVEPTDPVTFAAVLATLALAAWIAAYIPARRTTRLDPIEAIRAD